MTVAGIEPLQGQGLELRMNVKLRVQNPNDAPLDYNGVAVEMDVQGKTFATGVADLSGTIPRFGEAVISVQMSCPERPSRLRRRCNLAAHRSDSAHES